MLLAREENVDCIYFHIFLFTSVITIDVQAFVVKLEILAAIQSSFADFHEIRGNRKQFLLLFSSVMIYHPVNLCYLDLLLMSKSALGLSYWSTSRGKLLFGLTGLSSV